MKTLTFPNHELAALQASSWVAKIDRGLSAEMQAELSNWLAETPAHGEALVKYAAMWDKLDVLESIATILPIETIEGELLVDSDDETVAGFDRVTSRRAYAVAASLLVSVVVLFLAFDIGQQQYLSDQQNDLLGDSNVDANVFFQQYTSDVGESKRVTLLDGSELVLNTDTEVSIEFGDTLRKVVLEKGEVYFDVAKNPLRPFVAVTPDSRVTAVGTAFNIEIGQLNRTEVLVTEGRVKVDNFFKANQDMSAENAEVFLSKGQKAVIQQEQAQVSTHDDFESDLAWRQGMIVFNGETLAQVVKEIDRYTPLSMEITNDQITAIQVGGFFQTGDMAQLLLVLEKNFGVKSRQEGQRIVLY